jgi:hypothetical protein
MLTYISQIKESEVSNTNLFSLYSKIKEIIMKEKISFILFFIIGITVFSLSEVFGQSSDDPVNHGNFLKVGFPIVHNQVKDNLVAPLKWDGLGSGICLSYMSTGPRVIHEVSLIMSVSGLKNRYKYTGYALELSLGYTLSCMVIPAVWGGTVYLGPQIRWDGKTNFFKDWDDSHIYWFSTYEFGPSLKWSKDYKEKQNILFTMQLPFVALVSRPPENQYIDQPPLITPSYYFKSLNKDLRLVTLNNYFSFRLQVDYSYKIKSGNLIGGSWLFDYKSCKIPRNTTIITNIMMINYYKVFGKK